MRFTTTLIAVAAMTAAACAAITPAAGTSGVTGLVQPAPQSGFFDARFDATTLPATTPGAVDLVGTAGHGGPAVRGGQQDYTKQSLGLLGQTSELASGQRTPGTHSLTPVGGNIVGRDELRVMHGVRVVPIPVPGAVLLGAIGVTLVGWMQRRS